MPPWSRWVKRFLSTGFPCWSRRLLLRNILKMRGCQRGTEGGEHPHAGPRGVCGRTRDGPAAFAGGDEKLLVGNPERCRWDQGIGDTCQPRKSDDPQLQDTGSRLLGKWNSVDAAPVLMDLAKIGAGGKVPGPRVARLHRSGQKVRDARCTTGRDVPAGDEALAANRRAEAGAGSPATPPERRNAESWPSTRNRTLHSTKMPRRQAL